MLDKPVMLIPCLCVFIHNLVSCRIYISPVWILCSGAPLDGSWNQLCFPLHLSAPNKDPTAPGFPGNFGPLAARHTVSILLMEVELLNSSPPGNAPVWWGAVRFLIPSHPVKKKNSVGNPNKFCHARKYRS